jgi:exopolysaccharide biosynthesis predicted pyruvyltransferase EpsI
MDLCEKESSPKSPGNMMVYLMDESRVDIANSIASKKNLTTFSVNAKTKSAKASLYDRIYPPVTNWIRGFYDAEFVVTDSFHGCVFSILFNKPFIAIGHEIGGMAPSGYRAGMSLLEEDNGKAKGCEEGEACGEGCGHYQAAQNGLPCP